MSKAKRKEAAIAREQSKKRFVTLALAALLLVGAVLAFVNMGGQGAPESAGSDPRLAALASEHAATIGNPDAKAHIVEFLFRQEPAVGQVPGFPDIALNPGHGQHGRTGRHENHFQCRHGQPGVRCGRFFRRDAQRLAAGQGEQR